MTQTSSTRSRDYQSKCIQKWNWILRRYCRPSRRLSTPGAVKLCICDTIRVFCRNTIGLPKTKILWIIWKKIRFQFALLQKLTSCALGNSAPKSKIFERKQQERHWNESIWMYMIYQMGYGNNMGMWHWLLMKCFPFFKSVFMRHTLQFGRIS